MFIVPCDYQLFAVVINLIKFEHLSFNSAVFVTVLSGLSDCFRDSDEVLPFGVDAPVWEILDASLVVYESS